MRRRAGKLYWDILAKERYSHKSQSWAGIPSSQDREWGHSHTVQSTRPTWDGQGPPAHPTYQTAPSPGKEHDDKKLQVAARAHLGNITYIAL